MLIRKARQSDSENLFRIESTSKLKDLWSKKNFENLESDQNLWFVLEDQDQILGYCLLSQVKEEAHLWNIVLDKPFHGKGLSKTFLSLVKKECLKLHIKKIALEVRSENIPAIRLYESLQFVRDYEGAIYPDGNGIRMHIELN